MKKFIYTLGIVAAAAFAFSACQKEKDVKENPSDKLVTITFTAEKAGLGTRTAAVEGENSVSFIWTDEDIANMKLFSVGEDAQGKETLTVIQNPTVTKVSDTKLTISASVAPATYTFRAVLAGQWTNDGKKPRVKDIQSPSTTNYDPSADVLISDDMEVEVVGSGEATVATQDMAMVFRRPIVVNKMTLKNLTAGDVIKKVVISGDKNIAGSFTKLDPFADKDAITINYNDGYAIPEGGQFPVYFTTLPASSLKLTVEVTTNQFVYTKSFAEGATINFNKGEFTTFGFALPTGVANTALTLPLQDSMEWAMNPEGDLTAELSVTDWADVLQDGKKIYASSTKAYKGVDGMKLGSSGARGSITTNQIDLSSAFYVAIDAKTYGTDESQLVISIDGQEVFTSGNLTSEYKTYYADCSAATSASTVTIGIKGKRGYIKSLSIKEGESPAPPKINVTSDNPMSVTNENDLWEIDYSVSRPVEGESISASSNVAWIHDFDYSDDGVIVFEVDAQESNAAARTGVITLSYTGADNVEVTVNQARGPVSAVTADNWSYTFTSNPWEGTSGDADLVSGETTISWNLNAGYAAYNSGYLALSSSNNKADATILSNNVVSTVSKIVVAAKTNNTCEVTLTVKVGDTTLGTETLKNVSSLTDYTFTSATPISGKISIEFTNPSSGYQIKRIDINPAAPTVTDISVEDYTATFTASESGSYTFDGKVYAVYSDNSKVEVTSGGYTVTGTVDLTTAGTYTLTVSATIEGTNYSKDIEITVNAAGVPTEQTLFLETFGSTSSTSAYSSYTGYSATTAMFSTSGNVNTHYSGSGSVGKNNLSGVNLSSGYDGASGLSGCYHTGTANTTATILQISDINIQGATNISVSFGALGSNTSHKVDVYYKIDGGSETALITNGSITNANWTLLSAAIEGTGQSLTLIFKHTPSKAWLIRMDDIKVIGTK